MSLPQHVQDSLPERTEYGPAHPPDQLTAELLTPFPSRCLETHLKVHGIRESEAVTFGNFETQKRSRNRTRLRRFARDRWSWVGDQDLVLK